MASPICNIVSVTLMATSIMIVFHVLYYQYYYSYYSCCFATTLRGTKGSTLCPQCPHPYRPLHRSRGPDQAPSTEQVKAGLKEAPAEGLRVYCRIQKLSGLRAVICSSPQYFLVLCEATQGYLRFHSTGFAWTHPSRTW